jgi:hypothetical protein
MIRARNLHIAGASDMSNRLAAAILAAGFLLVGCSGSSSDGIGPTDPTSGNGDPGGSTGVGDFHPNFVPLSGVLPYPTDLYFSGSTDGTLDLPEDLPFLPNAATINALDGFSTVAPITANFSAAIDPATISGTTVYLLEVDVDNGTKATIGFRRLLLYGTDYTAQVSDAIDSAGKVLEIVPLKPLTPSSGDITIPGVGYLVVLTNGLRDTSGNAATPDSDYLAIKNALPTCAALTGDMNGICLLTGAHLQLASAVLGAEIVPATVLTFSFSTQSTADTVGLAAALAQPGLIGVVATGATLQTFNPNLPPIADVYAGVLEIPYYLDAAAPTTGYWEAAPGGPGVPSTNLTRFNPVPVVKSTEVIPMFVTVPNAASGHAKPVAGWPVVIFQHAITGNRAQAVAIAGAYASQGFVVASIDLPLHGITNDPEDPFSQTPLYAGEDERTFNLDLVNNDPMGPPGPDGVDDPSGSYFFNLSSLLTSSDNLRQAAVDIVQLVTSLPNLDIDGGGADVDATRIHYSALSIGAMVGTVANAQPIPMVSAYLNAPGGGVADLLRDSETFGPRIQAGLEAEGLVADTTMYDNFFRDAQTAVDAGDPLNFIAAAVAARPVLLTQVQDDAVVPNTATQRLVAAVPTFFKASMPGPNPVTAGQGTWVDFNSGSHGSLLLPDASLDVTMEMQRHAAFLAGLGNGAEFVITRPDLLVP